MHEIYNLAPIRIPLYATKLRRPQPFCYNTFEIPFAVWPKAVSVLIKGVYEGRRERRRRARRLVWCILVLGRDCKPYEAEEKQKDVLDQLTCSHLFLPYLIFPSAILAFFSSSFLPFFSVVSSFVGSCSKTSNPTFF